MTVRRAVILTRLAHLGSVLASLDRLAGMSDQERTSDPLCILAAERALQVAAEAIFDIGHHVLAGRGKRVPAAYRDVVPALVAAGIFPPEAEERLAGLAGVRNLLVHDYADVDSARIWELVDERIDDLRRAQRAFEQLDELR